jgi:hypothetical protein
MNRLTARELQEVEDLAAESELDHETALVRALELIALRRLLDAAKHRRRHTFAKADDLPTPGDTAPYRQCLEESRAKPYDRAREDGERLGQISFANDGGK